MAADRRSSQHASLRVRTGIAPLRVGALMLAEILIVLASASEVQAYAGADMTAGDVFYNISRGMMVQEFFAPGRAFSIPVLWLTNILVLLFGTVVLTMPSHDGIERGRMMASCSRTRYWLSRCVFALIWPLLALIIRLACSEAFALAWGGTTAMGLVSDGACILFESQGVVVWGGAQLVATVLIELIGGCAMCLSLASMALATNAPIACMVAIGYVVVGVYSCAPFFLTNWMMAYRTVEYGTGLSAVLGAVVGTCVLLACCAYAHVRLRRRDVI